MTNADQLADPMLFRSSEIFQQAVFPSAHTFLLKWPLFWLIAQFHYHHWVVYAATVGSTLMVVGATLYGIMRLERRPLERSVLTLALTSLLLVIPAQPYAGALLPQNMAMLTTRNTEYVIFVAAIWLLLHLRARKTKPLSYAIPTLLLAILYASDKLFVTLAFGASIVTILYGIIWRRSMRKPGIYVLSVSIVAFVLATVLLMVFRLTDVTIFIGGDNLNPYGLAKLQDLPEALIGALAALLTNYGASPIDNLAVLKDGILPTVRSIFHIGLFSHLVNLLLLVVSIYSAWHLVRQRTAASVKVQTAGILLASSLTSIGLFVVAKHNYPVDARYLAISFFALFFSLVIVVSALSLPRRFLVVTAAVLLLSICLGAQDVNQTTSRSLTAMEMLSSRNNQVVRVLEREKITRVVGDYWRVYPIADLDHSITVQPLSSCRVLRQPLASGAWQVTVRPFAYLQTNTAGPADFSACTVSDAEALFGPATNIVTVNDKESLVIYR